jgi:ribonuclease HI
MYVPNYRYLVTVFHKHGHPLRERLETLNRLNSERCMKGFGLVAQVTFQPSRTYAQYDLAALVSDIDETTTDALVDKYPSAASRELATITSANHTENVFYTNGSMIYDIAAFAVHNRNYKTGHQLAKPSKSVFSAEISAIRMALEHIKICPRGRYLILSDSLSSFMAMRPRRITCKTHPWVYESKQIYWGLQHLNYDLKIMWIPSHVGISGNEVADSWPDRQ